MLSEFPSLETPYADFANAKIQAQRWVLTCQRLPSGPEGRAGPKTTVMMMIMVVIIITIILQSLILYL